MEYKITVTSIVTRTSEPYAEWQESVTAKSKAAATRKANQIVKSCGLSVVPPVKWVTEYTGLLTLKG